MRRRLCEREEEKGQGLVVSRRACSFPAFMEMAGMGPSPT